MTDFTVMTWNVQNLFLPSDDAGPDTQDQFDAKVASLVAVIDEVQPAVLALQEVGPNALTLLEQALTRPMPHVIEGEPDQRGIRVGFLSTEPFVSTRRLRPFPHLIRPVQLKDPVFDVPITPEDESMTSMMGRGALEVAVSIDSTVVTILNAHFKSKLITYARQLGLVGGSKFQPNDEGERYRYAAYALYRRTGEAVTIRQRLNELLADPGDPEDPEKGTGREAPVVFCGDLNDEIQAATTQIIQGPSGSEIGTGGFPRSDKGDGFRLWNLSPLLPEGSFTRMFKGRPEIIDHIFGSHVLVNPDNVPLVQTVPSPDPLPSMDENANSRRNETGSDHAAVVATFDGS